MRNILFSSSGRAKETINDVLENGKSSVVRKSTNPLVNFGEHERKITINNIYYMQHMLSKMFYLPISYNNIINQKTIGNG